MKKVAIPAVLVLAAVAAAAWYWPRHRGPESLRLPGTVEVQEVRLGSKVGGRVAAVHVRESQVVEAGQLLVTFEAPELAARRDQASPCRYQVSASLESPRCSRSRPRLNIA